MMISSFERYSDPCAHRNPGDEALHARLKLIPQLTDATLGTLAAHIIAVTVLAVLFVVAGVAFRFGGVG